MPEILSSDDLCLKGLVVGPAGGGKTSLFATAADVEEMSPTCVLDFEGGTLSIAHRKDVYRERIKSTSQLQSTFFDIANGKGVHADIKSYFIDSGSEFAELCLEEVSAAAFQASQQNDRLAPRASIDDVQLKDYGSSTRRTRRLFRWFKDLDGKHVLISALPQFRYPQPPSNASETDKRAFEENIKRGLIKPIQIVPAFTQKLGDGVVGFVDFAWYLNVIEKEGKLVRQLITQRTGPLLFIKTRGPHFAEALGAGVEVTMENGTPTINGQPAMRYLFNLYRSTLAKGVKS